MAKDFKEVEVFQISVIITDSQLRLTGQEAFLPVPSHVDKVPLSEQKQPDFTGF